MRSLPTRSTVVPAPRRRRRLVLLVPILLWLGPAACAPYTAKPVATTDPTLEALVEAMGERLRVMPAVAEWKRRNDRPVVDRERESIVLANAVQAVDEAARRADRDAYPEAAIRRFYQAQIDAAVAIQHAVLSRPPIADEAVPDLLTEIRPALDRTGARIAELVVHLPPELDVDRLRSMAHAAWRIEGLEPAEIDRLVEALVALVNP